MTKFDTFSYNTEYFLKVKSNVNDLHRGHLTLWRIKSQTFKKLQNDIESCKMLQNTVNIPKYHKMPQNAAKLCKSNKRAAICTKCR